MKYSLNMFLQLAVCLGCLRSKNTPITLVPFFTCVYSTLAFLRDPSFTSPRIYTLDEKEWNSVSELEGKTYNED